MPKACLREGYTCWRKIPAKRAKVLIDGAAYYGALRAALGQARHSIFIVGWDIDSRTPLVGPSGQAEDARPTALGAFLTRLVEERPELRIYVLLWDYSLFYALEREPLPSVNLDWTTPPQISVCLDDALPVGASHHQKIVVVDDAVAFSGGLDLAIRRWDVSEHRIHDDRRRDPGGSIYRPFHDIQMMVDGEAAQALASLVRRRWLNATGQKSSPVSPTGDPWPEHVTPDFTDATIGIARTFPAYDGNPEIREVEALHLAAISRAERILYFENQFITAHRVCRALVNRMQQNSSLEVLIVAPKVHNSWLEEHAMNTGRIRFMQRLKEAGVEHRLALVFPSVPNDDTGEGIMVHSKFTVVDDWLLRVGSANLNNRSMGTDSECDLAIEATCDAERWTIANIRNRLLSEHLGVESEQVASSIAANNSFLDAIRNLSNGDRGLKPIVLDGVPDDQLAQTVERVADPERPISPTTFIGDVFGAHRPKLTVSRSFRLASAAMLLLGMVALWRYTPLSELTDPAVLIERLKAFGESFWMPAVIPGAFLVGTLVVFPVTALIAVTGMMFEPLVAICYAMVGSILGASATYFIGKLTGRSLLQNLMGRTVNRVRRALVRQGVLSIVAVRMVPVAPFTFINLVAGASGMRFGDFIFGTVLGMAPGIVVIAYLGSHLANVLRDPSLESLGLFIVVVIGWLGLSIGLQHLVSRLRGRAE